MVERERERRNANYLGHSGILRGTTGGGFNILYFVPPPHLPLFQIYFFLSSFHATKKKKRKMKLR